MEIVKNLWKVPHKYIWISCSHHKDHKHQLLPDIHTYWEHLSAGLMLHMQPKQSPSRPFFQIVL